MLQSISGHLRRFRHKIYTRNHLVLKQCNEAGMNVSKMEGPDFVMIDGDRIFHSAMIRDSPTPTRVDEYQFYSTKKKYIITTSYRVKDKNEWEGVLSRSVRSIRKK